MSLKDIQSRIPNSPDNLSTTYAYLWLSPNFFLAQIFLSPATYVQIEVTADEIISIAIFNSIISDWCQSGETQKAPIISSRPNVDDGIIYWKIYLKFLIQVPNLDRTSSN
ncbi:MAG: hypothetical protein ACRD9Q_02345 [Nitrososphaeraceae archaeon]